MRDYALGTTLDVKFTTRRFTTGVPFALAGGTVAAYPDNSVTEVTLGVTLTADFDARTGLNNVRVVATSGNGFAAGVNYALVLTAGTVDSVSVVGEVVGEFSLEAQSPLRPTTAGRTLDVSATGEGGLDWANVGSPTTVLNLSGTTVSAVSGAVGSVTGAVGSVTGNVGGNVAGSVGSVTGAVGSVAANGVTTATFAVGTTIPRCTLVDTLTTYTGNTPQTGDSFARIGATGAGLTTLATAAALSTVSTRVLLALPAVAPNADGGLPVLSNFGADLAYAVASAGSVGLNGITALSVATSAVEEIRDAIWAAATRTVSAATNITSTGGTLTVSAGGRAAIQSGVTKNVALSNFQFLMVLASDHVTGATGLTVTATRSLDGAAFAACANAVTEVANGMYKITLAAADLNADTVVLKFTAATADARFIEILPTA